MNACKIGRTNIRGEWGVSVLCNPVALNPLIRLIILYKMDLLAKLKCQVLSIALLNLLHQIIEI